MNNDIIEGKWKQMKGDIKRQWGDLTDDDLSYERGSRDYLAGKIQERYGRTKEEAEEEIREFERRHMDRY